MKAGGSSYRIHGIVATGTLGLWPSTLNVGLAQRTRELSRTTRVQSIAARQTANMNVSLSTNKLCKAR
jgi:hypothetical protein